MTIIILGGKNMSQSLYQKLKDLQEEFGVSRATLYRWIKEYNFPKPYKLGPNTSLWFKPEVDDWVANRPRGCKHNVEQS